MITEHKPIEVGFIGGYKSSEVGKSNSPEPLSEETVEQEKKIVKPEANKKEKRETPKKEKIARNVKETLIEQINVEQSQNYSDFQTNGIQVTKITSIGDSGIKESIGSQASQESSELAYADYGINPKPEYPMIARRNGYEGLVLLRVLVLESGKVGKIELEKSSGFGILDKSAIEAVEVWKFVPGKRDGIPISSWVTVPIRFQLSSG